MSEDIANLIKPLAKTAIKLNLRKIRKTDELAITGTYFGGQPYAEAGEDYPVCPTCAKPLNFICQLDVTKGFHEPPKNIAFFTFFYCFECSPWGMDDEKKGAYVIRTYDAPNAKKFVLTQTPPGIESPTELCAADAEKITVFPNWEELDNLPPEIAPAFDANGKDAFDEYAAAVEKLGGDTDFATIIGGYPFWVQGAQTLECGVCRSRMKLLAQIDSEEKAGLGWGDSGLVYLFYCENHASETKLILQCF